MAKFALGPVFGQVSGAHGGVSIPWLEEACLTCVHTAPAEDCIIEQIAPNPLCGFTSGTDRRLTSVSL